MTTSYISDGAASWLYSTASFFTIPVCKAREYYYLSYVIDEWHPEAYRVSNFARTAFYTIGSAAFAGAAIFTAPTGAALREFTRFIHGKSFLEFRGTGPEKQKHEGSFSLLSWNICGIPAGYSITAGGVLPWEYRIGALTEKIREKNPDVLCLYEVFDADCGFDLYELLKDQYAHFYINIGPRAIGPGSGMFVASKFRINDPEFVPYPKEMLVGSSKSCERGFFSFDIETSSGPFARIFSTHLQHSDEVSYPTDQEIAARRSEMDMVIERVNQVRDRTIVLTGDLNFDDRERESHSWNTQFIQDQGFSQGYTWGGDERCAQGLMGLRASDPCNLDYTMFKAGTAASIQTSHVKTDFNPTRVTSGALSDHRGLYSLITMT